MRPLMLLLLAVPLLVGALALVSAPTSTVDLVLPPRAQWTWVHRLRAAGFASDCRSTLKGPSAQVATAVLPDGRVRMSCAVSRMQHLPEAG
jgi:hypothetical protein